MCTPPSISYSFNPSSVWSVNGSAKVDLFMPKHLLQTLEYQSMHTMWIKIFFLVSLGLSALCTILGGITCCVGAGNRHPAFERRVLGLVALASLVSTIFLLAGAGLATRAYQALLKDINPVFGNYIIFSLGRSAIGVLWLSALFALIAAVFWIQSWRKEQKYKRLQRVGGPGNGIGWNKNSSRIIVEEVGVVPSGETKDDKPLLQKDTAYHSPTRN